MELEKDFPSVVKYMGSKTDVLTLIQNGINFLNKDYNYICDLFAGSATLSAALRNKVNVISNDIQNYSEVFARTYLDNYRWNEYPDVESICEAAAERVTRFNEHFSQYSNRYTYDKDFSLQELNVLEEEQRSLLDVNGWEEFDNYYLFVRYYSGTYWSYSQCVWIDSFKYVIDQYNNLEEYSNLLLTCLIYAMAYNSQSTGHYAQYRIPENDSSMEDILIYRRKNIKDFFVRKYEELKEYLSTDNQYMFQTLSYSDLECLNRIPKQTLVYADPPYCFVHYSRFYHILETLVRYDYPNVQFKGRYRDDRYQSKYCIKSEVTGAFKNMFTLVKEMQSDLLLSYSDSDTNTITFDRLIEICCNVFNKGVYDQIDFKRIKRRSRDFLKNSYKSSKIMKASDFNGVLEYEISIMKMPYNHSRMGRTVKKTIQVSEVLIIVKRV